MDINNVVKIVSGIIISIGGSGVIVWFFVRLSANTLADNYKKKVEHEFERKLEGYKNQLEILRASTLKYNDKQFELYIDLWKNLQELKFVCEDLWETANKDNLKKFHSALQKANKQIETSSILIDEEHYLGLVGLILEFQNYEEGKKKLVANWNSAEISDIELMINKNLKRKKECLELINKLKYEIRNKIKGIEN